MCTVHANSAHDAITKICTLPLLAGANISASFVVPTVASCIDLVVHCARSAAGRRQVTEIVSLGRRVENGVIETSTVFTRRAGELVANPSAGPAEEKFSRAGFNVMQLLGART
jgi:pilus assembly protein CpaF